MFTTTTAVGRLLRFVFLLGCWASLTGLCQAQSPASPLAQSIRLSNPNGTLGSVLAEISQQTRLTFGYSDDVVVASTPVKAPQGVQSVKNILDAVLTANGLTYTVLDRQIIIRKKPAARSGKVTFSGYVRDAATGENLIGVAVVQPGTGLGTATNTYGFYSLTLPAADSVALLVSYLSYEQIRWTSAATSSVTHNFNLKAVSNELAGVEVVGSREEKLAQSTRMGTINVPVTQIKALPRLFGETDVLKVMQLLPGVQSGSEGQSGLYVRGGSPDQNLILLDGTPVYNAAHLFGFFSVFNADALNNVELIKGGFPARYGGRLSSVLDITMKEGNMQEFHGEGAIGLVASKLTLEGPIKKDVASFIVSGRRTYIDILARPLINAQFRSEPGQKGTLGYYFYDLNGKLNWKVSSRDRLYLSAYTGSDKFYVRLTETEEEQTVQNNSDLGWGNVTAALRWNRVLNDQLFVNTHFTYSQYQLNVGVEEQNRYRANNELRTDQFSLRYLSNIRDFSLKSDFEYAPNPNHYVRFGGQFIRHAFRPGALQSNNNIGDISSQIETVSKQQGDEVGLYVEDDYRLSERLKVNAGLRLNGFSIDKTFYPSIEPRVAARYLLTEDWSLKASYARTTQYIHLLTNSGIGLPTDLWVPATATIKPQQAQQLSLGAARTLRFKDEEYELSFESYYKPMRNLIEYQEGANFLGTTDNNWEEKVTSGNGWAYGGEVFVQKKTGRTTGWLGYTLAWSTRRFPELNQGRLFPYKYDRRHDASLVITHKLRDNLTLSGSWVYGTGIATTLAQGRFALGNNPDLQFQRGWIGSYQDYGDRNSYRMAAYHRLDLDLSKTKKKRWGEVVNSFSLYNAYSRRNPYYLYLSQGQFDGNGNVIEDPAYKQVSVFPIIPSFSKSFRF